MRFAIVLMLAVLAGGQSYRAVAYPWCVVADFTEDVVACITSSGHFIIMPVVKECPVSLAEIPDQIPLR